MQARPSPLAVCILLMGCHEVVEPSDMPLEGEDAGQTSDAQLTLTVIEGEGAVVMWTGRALEPDERLERLDESGSWQLLARDGQSWVDTEPAPAYRWTGPLAEVLARPKHVELELGTPELPLIHEPGSTVQRSLAWEGPELDGLELGWALQRDGDDAWLVEDDGSPAWSFHAAPWRSYPAGEAPTLAIVEWEAASPHPALQTIECSLLASVEGRSWVLARAESQVLELGRELAWGDPHGHSNLSFDGCEDPDNYCAPRGEKPGADLFWEAEQAGLDFLALTDHAEFDTYTNFDLEIVLDIYEATLALAAEADGGPVLPIVGYEWTAAYTDEDGLDIGGHRTVIFERLDPCEGYWYGAGERAPSKHGWGIEDYESREASTGKPMTLADKIQLAAEDCEPVRWMSWFHHSAYQPPRAVDWTAGDNRVVQDRMVEIHSEHGSSECYDPELEGCRWNINTERLAGYGSVQQALQEGFQLGFVGGTDNHEARPGSTDDGPGPIAGSHDEDGDGIMDVYRLMNAPGAVTGVYWQGEELTRALLFDGIWQRNTVAASWLFDSVRVLAVGQDGEVYLPGSEVPSHASPLRVIIELEEEVMDEWQILLLDPWNQVSARADDRRLDVDIDLAPGEVRYLRVDAWSGKTHHRLWASPWFGLD